MKNRQGFALVIVLILVALLTGITVLFITDVQQETGSNRNSINSVQGGLFAEGGIEGALQLLSFTLGANDYTTLEDTWAKPILLEEEQGRLLVTIIDESGKLNLNTVVLPNGMLNEPYNKMMRNLFRIQQLPEDMVDAIADWIDLGDTPNPSGAETDWYRSQRPFIKPRNGYMLTVDELNRIKGFDGDTVDKLRPFVTVYAEGQLGSPASPININTAPREVLAALDENMSLSLADRIIEYRKTNPFKNPAELVQVPGMSSIATALSTSISTKGYVYRILAEATVGDTVRVIEAVARFAGSTPYIIYWREF